MRRPKTDAAYWHVIARGARRLALFHEEADFLKFLSLLTYVSPITGCILRAYALMSNHYHLILYGSAEQLSQCMHRLNLLYSAYHNEKYGFSGHAFDGPYKAFYQWTFFDLLCSVIYVFLNPVRAGLVKNAEDYRWSSVRAYLGMAGSPLEVDPLPVLGMLHPELECSRVRFREFLARMASLPPSSSGDDLSVMAIHQQHFEWYRLEARKRVKTLDGERPTAVAMYWAHEAGVFPRAIALSLKETPMKWVYHQIDRISRKVRNNPEGTQHLAPP